jgi:RNA polymerase-binding transcription factor DksA
MAKATRPTAATKTGKKAAPKAAAAATRRTTREPAKQASATAKSKKAAPKRAAKSVKTVKSPAKPAKKPAAKATKKAAVKKTAVKNTAVKKSPPPAKSAAKAAKSAVKPVKAAKPAAKPAKHAKAAAKAPAKAATTAPAKKAAAAKAPAKGKVAKAVKVVKGPPALVPKPAPSRPVLSEVITRKHRSPAVAVSTLERLRVLLLEEQSQHVRQAEGLLAEAEALANEREPGDTQFDEESGEGDTLSVERERDLALSASAHQTVDDIAKALLRMDDGSYGYCEVCGDRIPVPRLEAIPWADQCVKCKSRGERRR